VGDVWGIFLFFNDTDSDLAVKFSLEPAETKYRMFGLYNNQWRHRWSTTFLFVFLSTPIQNNLSLSLAFSIHSNCVTFLRKWGGEDCWQLSYTGR